MNGLTEYQAWKANGFTFLFLAIVCGLLAIVFLKIFMILGILFAFATFICSSGFVVNKPNKACILVFFGQYAGTINEAGLFWVNPLASKEIISLKVNNFNSEKLKVNDAHGNPIEIAAVIVWRVVDSAKAFFEVEDYSSFVAIQSETAIRTLASRYAYDSDDDKIPSLRHQSEELINLLKNEVQARLEVAGIEIIEARLSHLAYAAEIAQAMLRRQQATAVISARQKIVEGAVGMVQLALHSLSSQGIVELDDNRKASMVNNLMVDLISEQGLQPVVNTGAY